jgi:hypothetical protein
MFLTILSMLSGGLMRLLPEVLGLLNKKTDYTHELEMMDKQLEFQKWKGQDERETVALQGDISETMALLDAQKEAVKGQMQVTGVRFVDGMNFLVRPLTTYYFLLMYGVFKVATLVTALHQYDAWTAIICCWTADDATMLSGILAFWFVGRVFDKKQ